MKYLRITLLSTLLLSTVQLSWSASYHVSNGGEDTGPGTQTSPWAHCPGMSGWTGNAILNPGDTVFFNSADTWKETSGRALLAVVGGVTYDGSTWGYGSRAKFVAIRGINSTSDGIIRISDDDTVHETVVRGIEVDLNNQAASGIMMNRMYSKNLTGAMKRVENCTVHDIEATSMRYGILVGNESLTNTENVEVIDNTVFKTPRSGILAYERYQGGSGQVRNVIFRSNEVYHAGLSGKGTVGAGIDIKNDCNNIIVEQNYLHRNKYGVSVTNDDGFPAPKNVTIRHNKISHNSQGGTLIDNEGDKDAVLYGNVIHNNSGPGLLMWRSLSGMVSLKIYNNTFYDNAKYEVDLKNPKASFETLELKNNIIHTLNGQCVRDAGADITIHSKNLYYNSNGGALVASADIVYTASNIKMDYENTSITANPKYNDEDSDDFSLKRESPAISAGENLGYTYAEGLETSAIWPDKVSTFKRDQYGSTWEIGAYDYELMKIDENTIPAPKNLRIVNP